MCIFIDDWQCNFAGSEITLEICKTCIEARTLYKETKHDRALQKQKERMLEASPNKENELSLEESEVEKSTLESLELPSTMPEEKLEKENVEQVGGSAESKGKGEEESASSTRETDTEEEDFFDSLESAVDRDEESPKNENLELIEKKDEGENSVEYLKPISLIESENFQGNVDVIGSDPYGETYEWLRSVGEGKKSFLKIDFPEPPAKLDPEKEQEIIIKVRRTEDEIFFPPLPELNIIIVEDDRVVAESGKFEVEHPEGEVINFSWDAGKLSDLYGSNLQLIIESFASGDDGVMNRVDIGAVQWRAGILTDEYTQEDEIQSKERSQEEKSFSALMEEVK